MPMIPNPLSFLAHTGNMVWQCAKCGEIFMLIDQGEEHEKTCMGKHDDDAKYKADDSQNGQEQE